jgi:hypothetical protein
MPANTAQHPNEVYVGTLRDRRLRRVTNHNAFLAGVQLGRQETVSYTARDGWRIDGVLIHPVNAQPGVRAPLAVLPHGGPEGIDFDGWNTRPLSHPAAGRCRLRCVHAQLPGQRRTRRGLLAGRPPRPGRPGVRRCARRHRLPARAGDCRPRPRRHQRDILRRLLLRMGRHAPLRPVPPGHAVRRHVQLDVLHGHHGHSAGDGSRALGPDAVGAPAAHVGALTHRHTCRRTARPWSSATAWQTSAFIRSR